MSRKKELVTTWLLRITRIVPRFSTTNRRPEPSEAFVRPSGPLRPDQARSRRRVIAAGLKEDAGGGGAGAGPGAGAAPASGSQGNRSVLRRDWMPKGPLIQVRKPSVKAVQLSAAR